MSLLQGGSPLFADTERGPVLHGIASWSAGCGGPLPGVFTQINRYLEWIRTCDCPV